MSEPEMPAGKLLGPDVCPQLRTKTMYLNVEHRKVGEDYGDVGTAVFWCLKTFMVLGPDDDVLGPTECHRDVGRSCCTLPPSSPT